MRYAIVSNNTVVNVATADAPLGPNWIASSVAKIGDTYSNGEFTTPVPAVVVPAAVSMRQARLALLEAGKLADVEVAIDAIPDATQRAAAQIEWEYAGEVRRDSQLVQTLGPALGLDLDALFVAAAGK